MRYRHLRYRYAVIAKAGALRPLAPGLPVGVMLAQPRWRPEADVYETATAFTVTVEVGGIDEEDLEVTLFEDGVVVEGERRLACEEACVYHAASIRQGPFRLEVLLPATVDRTAVEAHYDRGLLRIRLPKARAA
jgi:HSP20 family molecular chaperone IbpA